MILDEANEFLMLQYVHWLKHVINWLSGYCFRYQLRWL